MSLRVTIRSQEGVFIPFGTLLGFTDILPQKKTPRSFCGPSLPALEIIFVLAPLTIELIDTFDLVMCRAPQTRRNRAGEARRPTGSRHSSHRIPLHDTTPRTASMSVDVPPMDNHGHKL